MLKLYNQAYWVYPVRRGKSREHVMTLQTRLFTGPLAAAAAVASSLPASHEQQQQATSPLSLNSPLNKHLGVARERNLSRMQLFTQSLGMFEWLPLFSICTPSPTSANPAAVCQSVFAEIWEGLMSQLLQDPTRNAF